MARLPLRINKKIILLIFWVVFAFWQPVESFASPISQEIENQISHKDMPAHFIAKGIETRHLKKLYEFTDYIPLWHGPKGKPTSRTKAFVAILEDAWREGLEPDDYHVSKINHYLENGDGFTSPAQADLYISSALLTYIRDVKTGRIMPSKIDPDLFMPVKDIDFVHILFEGLRAKDAQAYFADLPPKHEAYRQLREELVRLTKQKKKGLNKELLGIEKDDILLKPGHKSQEIAVIRKQLERDGLLEAPEHGNEKLFDTELENAIKQIQKSAGLIADGIIGPQTLAIIQQGYDDRLTKIKLNMERWRWLPDDLGEKHLLVNIAGFYVDAVENHKKVFSMPIIVGSVTKHTPVFSSVMPSVTFAPYWNVPNSIAVDTVLPKVQANPSYYNEAGFELIQHVGDERIIVDASQFDWQSIGKKDFPPFRFRQKPGPQNGLGPIRFNLINDMSIFLHGTPNTELFDRAERNVSSGCVRLKDTLKMAQFVLNETQAINKKQIISFYNRAMAGDQGVASHTVAIDKRLPVHIVYWTAWIGDDNTVRYANDIYGRDSILQQALTGKTGNKQGVE